MPRIPTAVTEMQRLLSLCAEQAAEIERLTRIEKAARDLDEAMQPHATEILAGWNEREWSWAWDALALALTPNAELRGAEPVGGASLSNAVFGAED